MAFSISPRVILSQASRERCVAKLMELPTLIQDKSKINTYASVLVPMCVVNDEVCLLYTKRSTYVKSHAGQVSFPGGKMDGDETAVQTALRETHEEIGVSPQDVDVWGLMSPQYEDVWGIMSPVQARQKHMIITPVVGEIKNYNEDTLIRNSDEVDEIFTVPLSTLSNDKNHAHLEFKPPLPVFLHGKHRIWGITALITHLFLKSLLPDEVYKVNFMRKKFTLSELMPSKL